MPSIYLACDPNCWSKDRVRKQFFGGTEYRFYHMRKWLMEAGYDVYDSAIRLIDREVDLVIHSNSFDPTAQGRNHILYAGSWHASFSEPKIDKIFVVSEYMKRKIERDDAIVIPPIYENTLKQYKGRSFTKGRVVCTSNPNRHFKSSAEVAKILKERKVRFSFEIMGGNRIYGPRFPECFDFHSSPYLTYHGILSRHNVLNVLTASHVWAYPNDEESETFCVSMIEAAAVGLPIVVMKKEPFLSVLPQAFFVESLEEMADKIQEIIERGTMKVEYDVSAYSEEIVKPKLLEEVRRVI